MTAPHIRRRQQMAAAAKINAEGKAAADFDAKAQAGTTAAPPYVDPYDAPQKPLDAMMKQAQAHFDNEPDEPRGFIAVLIDKALKTLPKHTNAWGDNDQKLHDLCWDAHREYNMLLAGQSGEIDQPGDDDPLAGLGLRAGDLEAVRDQIMEIVRPLQREHYRALFMAAVIQGRMAAGKDHHPESLAHSAMAYAEAACQELGL